LFKGGTVSQNPTDYDAIIIGAGATGLSAAVTLAEGGAVVLVFEKQPEVGGTSVNLRGTFAVESMMQQRKFIAYSRDQTWMEIMEFSHWLADPLLVRKIVNQSAETIDWLKEKGVVFTEAVTNIPHAPQTYHLIKDSGADVVKALYKKALDLNVTFRLSCPVTSILKNENRTYTIKAIETERDCQHTSKAVIIASGGYANNTEWINRIPGSRLRLRISGPPLSALSLGGCKRRAVL
jgi:fumarate reductase flavoprotein subunit